MKTTPVKIAGLVSLLAGLLLLIAGIGGWVTVSQQLAEAKITVSKDADAFAGATVADPFTAFAQAQVIQKHVNKTTGGKTYAELGPIVEKAKAAGDTETADKMQKARDMAQTASFLRSSLFTSVLAFGVSALAAGVGLVLGLIGWALMKLAAARGVVGPRAEHLDDVHDTPRARETV